MLAEDNDEEEEVPVKRKGDESMNKRSPAMVQKVHLI